MRPSIRVLAVGVLGEPLPCGRLPAGARWQGHLAAPAYAVQAPTNDEILREIQALGQLVQRLEQDNGVLRSENAELREKNDRMEATTEYLRDNASATRKQLAEDGPKVAEPAMNGELNWPVTS